MPLHRPSASRSTCRHPATAPSPASLRAVAAAWADARNGYLRFGRDRIYLIHGEPADSAQLQELVFALYEDEKPRFIDAAVPGKPVPPALPNELWAAAKCLADRSSLRGKGRGVLAPGPLFSRLAAFPMTSQTRRLLTRADRKSIRLGDTVRLDRELRMLVLDEVCTLIALDVIRLHVPAQRPAEQPSEVTRRPATVARVKVDASTERRLLREVRLLENADDWTVLGLGPAQDRERVEQACSRMESRYAAFADHPRLSSKARDAASRILARVHVASRNVLAGKGKSQGPSVAPALAFPEGKAQVAQGDFTQAAACFSVARQAQPMSGQVLAWLGFAIYFDSSRPITTRQGKGRRFIDKALSMGTAPGEANYLLARILHDEGGLVRAWNHVDAALRAEPTHVEANELHTSVQREIRRV
ncbi:MAG: hypothetical protein GY913_16245 [Proteobacteria bacterium]|nr:hypothetical protein [Pseudomonadota bacterium]